MTVTNPLDFTVTTTGSVGDASWELDDQTGQKLASGKASNDPKWSGSGNSGPPAAEFRIRDFIFYLPKSATGTLLVSPVRQGGNGVPSELPEVRIPVRFGSATSTLAEMVPKNFDDYLSEEDSWAASHDLSSLFNPQTPFVEKNLTVLHVDNVIFASAEAAAENPSVPSQAPIRILHFAVRSGVAYVDLNLNEDGWAGVSYTIARVEPLIERDLLQFPNIRSVVFSWPPRAPNPSVSPRDPTKLHEKGARSRQSVAGRGLHRARRWYDAG